MALVHYNLRLKPWQKVWVKENNINLSEKVRDLIDDLRWGAQKSNNSITYLEKGEGTQPKQQKAPASACAEGVQG